ncbi:MAG: hypothetical protein ACREHF_14755 [Rhizomicrobium sp.]
MAEVSLIRLYVLRAMYLLLAVGIGAMFWPHVVYHTSDYAAKNGAQMCLLAGVGALSVLGLRYPVKMLPVLLYEFFWKATWLIAMALPLWTAHRTYPGMSGDVFAIGAGVVLCAIVIPWPWVFANYVLKPGDRWR